MTSLRDRPNTALLVVDMQNDVVGDAYGRDAVIANINTLVDKARREDVPVIWVQHFDEEELPQNSEGWRYVAELQRRESEPLVHKEYGDAFEDTTLESELAQRRVGRLVVAGAETDACIRSTIHGAFTRGYDAAPRRRCAHCQRQVQMGCAAARGRDRPHKPVLEVPVGAGPRRRASSTPPTSTSRRWNGLRRSARTQPPVPSSTPRNAAPSAASSDRLASNPLAAGLRTMM